MAKDKIYYTVNELQPSIDELYDKGIIRGNYVGFECLEELYSLKLGSTTYIMGSPTSGKTEFWFELLMNTSEMYGWKHAIYTPETGNKEEIVAELCSKYLKKPFYKNYNGCMTDAERYRAMTFLNEHFFIIDPKEQEIDVDAFYLAIDELEKDLGVSIQTTTIDPYNELKHDFGGNGGRQDLYIERMLGMCRRNAVLKNRHNCIITHCADQMPITDNGITYYPAPTARQYAGGQAWYRKGMSMVGVWRPPVGLSDRDGVPYEENEVHIIIQKSKPKGTGKKGTAKLYFSVNQNRYFEKTDSGIKWACPKSEKKKSAIQQILTGESNMPF